MSNGKSLMILRMLKIIAVGLGLTGALVFLTQKFRLTEILDCLFISGILLLCFGLFRLTRAMQFYDIPIYSFHKLAEILRLKGKTELEDGVLNQPVSCEKKYNKPYIEIICTSAIIIAAAVLLSLVLDFGN